MNLKFLKFAVFLAFISCSTIEFIPEPEYTAYRAGYRKANWEEIEILRERPRKPFQIMGEIVIRNQSEAPWEELEISLKKEMWEKKMDGVWMIQKKQQSVDALSFETMDNRGHTTHSYKHQSNLPVWTGYAFRYK
ncbi:hypothetical protein [Leptospira idonii]|uniref:Uncharacterized protein n=1 Tax=Leptospira idonii TaxID=1193500 RepID=A0A4R9M5K2_9LEPT|nr:hypothetical protein [Leptospira idonii]TGN21085.1 hypothetical protein EHS15_00775 [Leptospira idonii]